MDPGPWLLSSSSTSSSSDVVVSLCAHDLRGSSSSLSDDGSMYTARRLPADVPLSGAMRLADAGTLLVAIGTSKVVGVLTALGALIGVNAKSLAWRVTSPTAAMIIGARVGVVAGCSDWPRTLPRCELGE